jgi:hypothetical protein
MRNLHSGEGEERTSAEKKPFVRQEKQKGKGEKLGDVIIYIYIY